MIRIGKSSDEACGNIPFICPLGSIIIITAVAQIAGRHLDHFFP